MYFKLFFIISYHCLLINKLSDKKYQWHLNVTLIPILELLYLIDNVVHLGELRDFEVYSKTLAQRKDLFQYF